jgi:hypothetical protein
MLSLFKIHHSEFCSTWAWRVKAQTKADGAGWLANLPRHAVRKQQYAIMASPLRGSARHLLTGIKQMILPGLPQDERAGGDLK